MAYVLVGISGRRKRRLGRHDAVTAYISHYGALIFSGAAVHEFRLSHAEFCQLFFDQEKNSLAIRLVPEYGETERRVYTTADSAHIMVTSLLREYGINLAADVNCPITSKHEEGVDLITVDITPAMSAAKMEPGKTVLPRRGATRSPRAKCVNTGGRNI